MAVCPNCRESNPEVGAACPRCEGTYYIPEGSLDDAESDPRIGRLAADKYVILELISEGGMGAVYRALQLPVEREVAFKVLRTELKDSDNGRERFVREARAVSRLNHPNIITLYDFGFEDGKHPYMVMEYAPGKSLAKWIRTEGLTTERIVHVTAQILHALTEAHERGIVHRDLKPENMIISKRGSEQDYVKLLDFGIARMINEGATRGLTQDGEVFGTPHYMAPEQAQGKKELGPSADIYAVGIMMFQMITGECPFDAPTPLPVLFMHINDPLPPIHPRDGLIVRPELEMIIQRACAKDPNQRYQDAGQMLADLFAVCGFSTGALPGMVGTDPSHEYSMGDTLRPTFTGGSSVTPVPQESGQAGFRQPQFTPAGFQSGVHVHDPEPSYVGEFAPGEDASPPSSNKKLGIVAAASVALVVVTIAALVVVISTSEESTAEAADGPAAELPTNVVADEVAVEDSPTEIRVEPIERPQLPDPDPAGAALAANAEGEGGDPADDVDTANADEDEAALAANRQPEPEREARDDRKSTERKPPAKEQRAPQKKAEPAVKKADPPQTTPEAPTLPAKKKWAPKATPKRWDR